jgi:hypothetical protein
MKEINTSWSCSSNERGEKYIGNFDGEVSTKVVALNTQKEIECNMKTDLRELGCEDRRGMRPISGFCISGKSTVTVFIYKTVINKEMKL